MEIKASREFMQAVTTGERHQMLKIDEHCGTGNDD